MIDTTFEWTLKKSEKERFIEYFNKNYFTFNKVWMFLGSVALIIFQTFFIKISLPSKN